MKVDEKAFQFVMGDDGVSGPYRLHRDELRELLEAYESAKSAEQPVDCREAFEKWMLEQRATKVNMRPEGFYVVSGIQQQWQIWQHLWKPEREIVLAKNPTESNDGKSDEK